MKFSKIKKETDPYKKLTAQERAIMTALEKSKPLLKDPEGLTENIMAGIGQSRPASGNGNKASNIRVMMLVRRMLAAASVCLFLSFSYEQYIVMKKISVLEKQNTAISRSEPYQTTLKIKKALKILEGDPAMQNEYRDLQKAGILNACSVMKKIEEKFNHPKNNPGK